MNKRFIFEMVVGIVTLVSVLLFGQAGYASFALMGFMPLFAKKKPDERELQLFYKSGNITLGLLILSLVVIDQLKAHTFGGIVIGDYWLNFSIAAFLVSHGASGLVISYKG